jgi:hypothetical protein
VDPYVEACARLEKAGVRYLIVGAFGINLYAGQVGVVITTADCDVMIPPDVRVLTKAVRALRKLGFSMEAGGDPLPDEDPAVLGGIVRARACVRAIRPDARIDLPLEISGASFDSLWSEHRRFNVEGATLRVGPLAALVRSKQLAGRPKDRAFLEAHRAALDEILRREIHEATAPAAARKRASTKRKKK